MHARRQSSFFNFQSGWTENWSHRSSYTNKVPWSTRRMQKYDTWLDFFELRGLSYRLCSLDERHHCTECVRTSLLYYKKDIWPFSHSQQQSRIKGQTESHFAIYSRNSVPCEFNCLRLLLKWEGEKTMGVRHWDDTSRKMTVSAVFTIKMRWKGERARREKKSFEYKKWPVCGTMRVSIPWIVRRVVILHAKEIFTPVHSVGDKLLCWVIWGVEFFFEAMA